MLSVIVALICVDWPAKTGFGVALNVINAGGLPTGSVNDVKLTLTRDETPDALAMTVAIPAVLPAFSWVCTLPAESVVADATVIVPRFVEKVTDVPTTGTAFAVVTVALITEYVVVPPISILGGVAVS